MAVFDEKLRNQQLQAAFYQHVPDFQADSSSRKSPGEVVRAFYLAANDGKYSEAELLVSEEAKNVIKGTLGQLAGGFKGMCDKNTKDGNISAVELVSEDIRGEGATVIVNVRFKDGTSKDNDKNTLIMQNGMWKLTIGE